MEIMRGQILSHIHIFIALYWLANCNLLWPQPLQPRHHMYIWSSLTLFNFQSNLDPFSFSPDLCSKFVTIWGMHSNVFVPIRSLTFYRQPFCGTRAACLCNGYRWPAAVIAAIWRIPWLISWEFVRFCKHSNMCHALPEMFAGSMWQNSTWLTLT